MSYGAQADACASSGLYHLLMKLKAVVQTKESRGIVEEVIHDFHHQ
jgi:hypothetical protein